MKPLSILIVEDDENVRAVLVRCVDQAGNQVRCVANGREAGEWLPRERYDLVITDILMPGRDGLDVITQCRRAQPAARILAISGGGRILEADDCLRLARGLGADAVLRKPFNREELLVAIGRARLATRDEIHG